MFSNYLKIALRNLRRNSTLSMVNIAGLALGLTIFLLITEYVASEWNANRFHRNYRRLYRVSTLHKEGNSDYYMAPGLGPQVKQKISNIADFTRVIPELGAGVLSTTRQQYLRENNIAFTDDGFFRLLSFRLLNGNGALEAPFTAAIAASTAIKLFGTTGATGKTMQLRNQFGSGSYTITGVFEDMPANSDIQAKVLLSINTLQTAARSSGNDWADPSGMQSNFAHLYLLLNNSSPVPGLDQQVTRLLHTLNPDTQTDQLVLQPFSELHLAPSFHYPLQTFGSLKLVSLFVSIALLILLIAWVNYINLSTAQALNRAKEVGVRKILGARRRQLVIQYLAETLLLTLTAFLLALLVAGLLQPIYNQLTGKALSLAMLNQPDIWLIALGLILTGTLLAGAYVAFALSSFNPAGILQDRQAHTFKGIALRKGLVVFQFAISILFIIASIVMYKQLQYMQTDSLGMNLQQLLVIKGPSDTDSTKQRSLSFKNQLAQLPFIHQFAASNNIPGEGYNFSANHITGLNTQPEAVLTGYSMLMVDEHFFSTYGIRLKEGMNFSAEDAIQGYAKAARVMVNEQAAKMLGFTGKDRVTGHKILWGDTPFEITGVIRDYHHLSLHESIQPTIYLPAVGFAFYTLQTDTRNLPAKIAQLKSLFQANFPDNPFEYFFADETFNRQYQADQKLGHLFVLAAMASLFVACLGLFGLVAFATRQRVKEIGIRKVLGAKGRDILLLLSQDFLRLVLLAALIATPVGWWGMHRWLSDFPYRTTLNWWIFALATAAIVLIALGTVSLKALRAVAVNPVKNLRSE